MFYDTSLCRFSEVSYETSTFTKKCRSGALFIPQDLAVKRRWVKGFHILTTVVETKLGWRKAHAGLRACALSPVPYLRACCIPQSLDSPPAVRATADWVGTAQGCGVGI